MGCAIVRGMLTLIVILPLVALIKLLIVAPVSEALTRTSREYRRWKPRATGRTLPRPYLPRGRVVRIVQGVR